jgi:hypothetical protein
MSNKKLKKIFIIQSDLVFLQRVPKLLARFPKTRIWTRRTPKLKKIKPIKIKPKKIDREYENFPKKAFIWQGIKNNIDSGRIIISRDDYKHLESSLKYGKNNPYRNLFVELEKLKVEVLDYMDFCFLFNSYVISAEFFHNRIVLPIKIRDAVHVLVTKNDHLIIKEINDLMKAYNKVFCVKEAFFRDLKVINLVEHLNLKDDLMIRSYDDYVVLWKKYIYTLDFIKDKDLEKTYSYFASVKLMPKLSVLKALIDDNKSDKIEAMIPKTFEDIKKIYGFKKSIRFVMAGMCDDYKFPKEFIFEHDAKDIDVVYPDGSYKIGKVFYASISKTKSGFWILEDFLLEPLLE